MSECFAGSFIVNGEIKREQFFDEIHVEKGKAIYEVIRIIDGVPLFLEAHLGRFANSASLINRALPMDSNEIKNEIVRLVGVNNLKEGNVKIVFTYSEEEKQTLFYFVKHSYPTTEQYEKGVETILFHGERDNPNAKVINKSFRERVDKEINAANAYEAILVDNEGDITEGSKSNIFLIKGDKVITSPLEAVLPGITRGILMDLIKEMGIELSEEKVKVEELQSMDALFISGTSPKVLPISRVDKLSFASATNKLVVNIMNKYDERIANYIKNFKTI